MPALACFIRMNSPTIKLFKRYLTDLLNRGVTRANVTDEARLALRNWYIAAKKGIRAGTMAAKKPATQAVTDSALIPVPDGTREDKLRYLQTLAMDWEPVKSLNSLRNTMVFATGNPHADIMLIGDAPGHDDEVRREPFTGKADEKLNQILTAMGLSRDKVYISNIVKFRPNLPNRNTNKRPPSPAEIAACLPFILTEISLIKPKVIIALGSTAATALPGMNEVNVASLRGKFHNVNGIPVRVTYHPRYLLRSDSPHEKRKVWEDMLAVMDLLNMPVTEKQRGYFLPKR